MTVAAEEYILQATSSDSPAPLVRGVASPVTALEIGPGGERSPDVGFEFRQFLLEEN